MHGASIRWFTIPLGSKNKRLTPERVSDILSFMVGNDANRNGKVASVKTNDLKKGTRIQLRNGWYATLTDNARGNVREARVEGLNTEVGTVYSHNIICAIVNGVRYAVEHTPAQLKFKEQVDAFF